MRLLDNEKAVRIFEKTEYGRHVLECSICQDHKHHCKVGVEIIQRILGVTHPVPMAEEEEPTKFPHDVY